MFPDSIIAAGKFLIVTKLLILVLYNGPYFFPSFFLNAFCGRWRH